MTPPTFVCDVCSKTFATRKYLTNHAVLHRPPTIPCEICHKLFPSIRRKNKHKEVHDESTKKFECADCGYKCRTKCTLVVHVRKHTNEKPYQCKQCDLSYKTNSDLRKHVKQIHEGQKRIFHCELCESSFQSRARLGNHISSVHYSISEVCQYCKKSFKSLTALKSHIKNRHEASKPKPVFPCKQCTKVFASKSGLLNHNRYKHDDIEKQICKHCGAELQTASSLRIHIKSLHLKVRDQVCPICARTFFGKSHLNRHMRTHSNADRVNCPKCNKVLSRGSLRAHLVLHKKPTGNHVCGVCSKKFKSKLRLDSHRRLHKVREKHFCALCKKAFVTIYGLKSHLTLHLTVGKPFKCPSCEQRFKTPISVRAHFMRVHERRMCYLCNRVFKTRAKRIQHMDNCHAGWRQRLKCPKCNHVFIRRSSLESHMKRHDKHVCDICGKGFIMKHLFTKHKAARHNMQYNYECQSCKYRFRTYRSLASHVRELHAGSAAALLNHTEVKVEAMDSVTEDSEIVDLSENALGLEPVG